MGNNQSNKNSGAGPKNPLDKLARGLIKVGKYEFEIPEYRFDLLYISTEEPRNVNAGSFKLSFSITEDGINLQEIPKDESSTIFLQLEIEKPNSDDTIEELGYFPNYARMDKKQRWVYLNWLKDVRKEINISFVFTYY